MVGSKSRTGQKAAHGNGNPQVIVHYLLL
jgi:hypothetical protein